MVDQEHARAIDVGEEARKQEQAGQERMQKLFEIADACTTNKPIRVDVMAGRAVKFLTQLNGRDVTVRVHIVDDRFAERLDEREHIRSGVWADLVMLSVSDAQTGAPIHSIGVERYGSASDPDSGWFCTTENVNRRKETGGKVIYDTVPMYTSAGGRAFRGKDLPELEPRLSEIERLLTSQMETSEGPQQP